MKRFLPVFPALLLLLLNACGDITSELSPTEWTSAVQTQTATMWTPTITPTHDPNESKIVEWLNEALLLASPLEMTLDAIYQAVDVSFPVAQDGSTSFRLDVRCECAVNAQCCIPERMFVVAAEAMKKSAEKIIRQVPGNVSEVKVVCFNHSSQIGVMAASWADVKGYLLDQINGYQLGSRTYRGFLP